MGLFWRRPREVTVNIANGASQTTEEIEIGEFTMFAAYVAAGTEGTHLQVMDVPVSGAAAVNSKDENAALKVVAFTAGETVDLPVTTTTLNRIKLKTCSNSTGTAQTQTGATTILLRMKS